MRSESSADDKAEDEIWIIIYHSNQKNYIVKDLENKIMD